MLIASRQGREHELPDFRAVAAAFRRVAPELVVHVTPVSTAVAALIGVPRSARATTFVADSRETFERVRALVQPSEHLVAGVSAVHAEPAGYRAAYREAREVIDCIHRFSPPGGPAMFTADDLGAGRLFLTTCDAHLMTRVADETFGGLVGDPSKADMLITLCSFFDNTASIRRSAECLGVHENTIRYRLSRFQELTGLAVMHDPDAKLRARLSLLVLMLEGRLPRSSGPPPTDGRASMGIVHRAV
jgi:DNA-binding PucR family transcriptional regulator